MRHASGPAGPAHHESAPTDAQELALTNAVDDTSPSGGTPISAALDGAIQFCSQFLTTHPDHKVVAILVTDGEPNGCTEDIPSISGIAANGLVEGVPTYTIGLAGSNEADLADDRDGGRRSASWSATATPPPTSSLRCRPSAASN